MVMKGKKSNVEGNHTNPTEIEALQERNDYLAELAQKKSDLYEMTRDENLKLNERVKELLELNLRLESELKCEKTVVHHLTTSN